MTIYITEAHAHDEWPIGEQYKVGFPQLNQPKSLQERFSAAAALKTDFDWPTEIYADDMDNRVRDELQGWPLRIYAFMPPALQATSTKKLTVAVRPEPRNFTYDLQEVREYLGDLAMD